ncbi:hypothetical protein [Hymenobacter sp. BRD67]|uniref:hypothetical protein n=1 Tax=Hymenobacter sp. BRD67 TaxID=2675877 RepID=UPI001564D338|nr:hypothetical protein [Hymenobacter sp. BRD67]QKG53765.1 hypothetical protein GKZ67_15630 [Hymenobacter sp. BRD67]
MTTSIRYSGSVARWLTVSCLAVGLSLAGRAALAQQANPATIRLLPEDEERGQYGHQQKFYFLAPGKTGEDYQSAGFFGQRLRPYLAGNTQALRELDKYKRQKTLYLVDKAVLVGSLGLYGSQVFSHGDPVYFNSTQQAAAGVAVVSLLATIFINHHTNEYIKQSIDDYNSDLSGKHGTVWPRLRPASIGVLTAPAGQPLLALRWQM